MSDQPPVDTDPRIEVAREVILSVLLDQPSGVTTEGEIAERLDLPAVFRVLDEARVPCGCAELLGDEHYSDCRIFIALAALPAWTEKP